MTAASWLAWTLPLFITECVLQGRKIFAKRAGEAPVQDAPDFSIVPEQAVLDQQRP